MAIFYFDRYSKKNNSMNFGDDINPFLLGKIFSNEIIQSQDICIMGIGSILNDTNFNLVSKFPKKIIFSSGAGYGDLNFKFDESWDFKCVRGPLTASSLSLDQSAAIADGAILISEFFHVKNINKRKRVIFIPHVESHWIAGRDLARAAKYNGMEYLVPDRPFQDFIDRVSSASLVVTEAMHGAILADTMRVPWIPVSFHFHNEFKWKDWFLSMGLEYANNSIKPKIWGKKDSFMAGLKYPYQYFKIRFFARNLEQTLKNSQRYLSPQNILIDRKERLWNKINDINEL